MLPNPLLRKIVQISEEALPPVHVPLILCNDFYVLTQQDVRKIEDSRLFSISKIAPNGDLKTINALDATDYFQQHTNQENLLPNQFLSNLLDFVNNKRNLYQVCQHATAQQFSEFNERKCTQPMDVQITTTSTASIDQQLQWNKCENSQQPFPIHYSRGTSTTETNCTQEGKDRELIADCCCETCQQCGNRIRHCSKSTNTIDDFTKISHESLDAREQLKKKKLIFSFT